MAITLLFKPWLPDKQEYSDVGIPFTFGNMTTQYYNEVSDSNYKRSRDYGFFIDNVMSRGTNILGTLSGPELDFSVSGILPSDFTNDIDTARHEIRLKYKINDSLFAEFYSYINVRGLTSTDDEGHVSMMFGIDFSSPLRSDTFTIQHMGMFTIPRISYNELYMACNGLNPINYFTQQGDVFGANAYPTTQEKVEESKTTTGCIIQSYSLQLDITDYDPTNPYTIEQDEFHSRGIKGTEVSPYMTDKSTQFWVPFILGFAYESDFPDSITDDILGSYDNESDEGSVQPLPEQSAVASGMVKVYQMSTTQLNNFANFLWSDSLSEWESLINNLKKWFSNPLDSIISLTISPVDVFYNYESKELQMPEASNIKLAGIDTGVSGYLCKSNYVQVSLGERSLHPYYNSFLDCNPHTKFSIYLPYIGFKDLDSDVLFSSGGTSIEVVYSIDIITGVCVANILIEKESKGTKLKHVIYTFSGNMNTTIPISSANMKDFLSASIGAVASGLAIVGTGGSATPLVIGSMAAQQGLNIASQKVNVAHSGGMSLEAGMFGIQYAYLIVTRPREARPSNYKQINGIPSEISGTLGQFSGFTQVSTVHVNIDNATEDEKQEIEKLLKAGVIL